MDPVSLVVAAVIAGASAGMTDAVKDEVKEAYSAFRRKLLNRFSADPTAEVLVEAVEDAPESEKKKAALTQLLSKEIVSEEDELVNFAKRVAKAEGVDVEQQMQLANWTTVRRSGQSVKGVTAQRVRQVMRAGEHALIEDSGQTITFGHSEDE
ncbi:hypothetical protein [Arthrobacter sp. NPDC057009]|uniref:hypothetical protein n=1 Tax=Arthrobacter sp. NPDC057009 TaxID=3345996 RepID=UPI00363B0771